MGSSACEDDKIIGLVEPVDQQKVSTDVAFPMIAPLPESFSRFQSFINCFVKSHIRGKVVRFDTAFGPFTAYRHPVL